MKHIDILVLGATGFTGRLIARYLSSHPQHAEGKFSLALGGRDLNKLEQVARTLGLRSDVELLKVDLMVQVEVEAAVDKARIIINAAGPYWVCGIHIVGACARTGTHYVDLSGESRFIQDSIRKYDYLASKTHAIIVHACGFDSAVGDIAAFLGAKTLFELELPPPDSSDSRQRLMPGSSTSVYEFEGGGVSGGTISSILSTFDSVGPQRLLRASSEPFALSPIVGARQQPRRDGVGLLCRSLVAPDGQRYAGSFFPMAMTNVAVVQRTFGLLEMHAMQRQQEEDDDDEQESRLVRYGPDFSYEEFIRARNAFTAILSSSFLILVFVLLFFRPTRALLQKVLPKSGEGPSESSMQNGHLVLTNITLPAASSPRKSLKGVQVKTVIKGRGEPGYLLSSVIISEAALSILLPPSGQVSSTSARSMPRDNNIANLPPHARQGGVLTPVTAFGEVLIKRLEESGRFEFWSGATTQGRC